MEFEGLQIDGPDDVIRHYEAGTATRPRDHHPTEWMVRFAAHDETAHAWVDEALQRLIVARGGAELDPGAGLGDLMNLASQIDSRKVLPLLRERLDRGIEDWSDQRAETFLQWLIGARPARASEPIEGEELERICALAARAGAFNGGGRVIGSVAPWRLVEFARAHVAGAVERGERALERLAFFWVEPVFAPYRLELLLAVAAADASLTAELRRRIEAEVGFGPPMDLEGVFEAAWEQPDRQTPVFATMVARVYAERGVPTRRALLVHPRDARGMGLPADFDEYAAAVQERADTDDAPLRRPSGRLVSVGEPEPMPEGTTDGIEMLWIPLELETEDGETPEDRLLIYRLGDRFKVGLALARTGKAAKKPKS
jgi:hypothetical protein